MWVYRLLSRVSFIIAYMILIFVPFYITIGLIWVFQSFNLLEIMLNLLLLLIEIIGFSFAFYLVYMIAGAFQFHANNVSIDEKVLNLPFFSIIIPSHGTSFSILEETLLGALKIKYDNYEIIVSDNGQDSSTTNQLKTFCEKNKIKFYHKDDTRGFKAGNINVVLSKTKGEYIVILDSDHIPVPSLLTEFAKILGNKKYNSSDNIGFIQAKVSYRNAFRLYQKANSILYSQFFEVFEAGKHNRGMVLFNGSTGCFRKKALIEEGGFSEQTLIEDIDTSIKILCNNYSGKYLNFVGSKGLVPETAKKQVAQLWRWAHGACSILRLRTRPIFASNRKLSEKGELILNAMAFFSGISVVALIITLALLISFQMSFLRPSILGIHTGFIMPSLVGVFFSISSILAISWEERQQNFIYRLLQLIPFYLFSLGAFMFLISGIIEGLMLKNTPQSEGRVWNRQIHTIRDSLIILGVSLLIVFIGIVGVLNNFSGGFGWFVIGGALSWMLAPLVLLWEEISPPAN